MRDAELLQRALEARENAWAPYSGFWVGAALLAKDGRVFTGCNIENAAYSPGNCAERTAFFKAVSEGARAFEAIAVVGGPSGAPGHAYPCGVCRQVMMEFCGPGFRILVGPSPEDFEAFTLGELLPHGFGPKTLKTGGE